MERLFSSLLIGQTFTVENNSYIFKRIEDVILDGKKCNASIDMEEIIYFFVEGHLIVKVEHDTSRID